MLFPNALLGIARRSIAPNTLRAHRCRRAGRWGAIWGDRPALVHPPDQPPHWDTDCATNAATGQLAGRHQFVEFRPPQAGHCGGLGDADSELGVWRRQQNAQRFARAGRETPPTPLAVVGADAAVTSLRPALPDPLTTRG